MTNGRPMAAMAGGAGMVAVPGDAGAPAADGVPQLPRREEVNLIEDLTTSSNRSPQKRLEQIVDFDEKQAATILRQWMRTDGV